MVRVMAGAKAKARAGPMPVIVAGAAGRMGRAVVRAAHGRRDLRLAGALEAGGAAELGRDAGLIAGIARLGLPLRADAAQLLAQAGPGAGLIDFTAAGASGGLAREAARSRAVYVVGTTGLTAADRRAITAAARRVAVIQSENMSPGLTVLAELVRRTAQTLGPDWDIEIGEIHHRAKIDAPSGTALLLGRAAAQGRGRKLESLKAVRAGNRARRAGQIGFASLRGGTLRGQHDVIFAGTQEHLRLSHSAEDRSIFAAGALRAALWGRARRPGLYTMRDVLNLT